MPQPVREEPGELLAARRQVVAEEEEELGRLLRQTIHDAPEREAAFALLTSMPGCGPILAATLTAEMQSARPARPAQDRGSGRLGPGR